MIGSGFQRDYLIRLPLPLAQLYSRAYNAKDTRARHDNAYYLFESLLKLAACPMIGAYVDERRAGSPGDPRVDDQLKALALPSLGQWVGMLRSLANYYHEREVTEAESAAPHLLLEDQQVRKQHYFAQMHRQLTRKHRADNAPAMLALFNQIKNGPDDLPGKDKTCQLITLFDKLVQYRNSVVGHGGPRFEAFYEEQMGPLMFPAVNEVLSEGFFDLFGMPGAQLVQLNEMRMVSQDHFEVSLRELVGLQGQRMAPLEIDSRYAAALAPRAGGFSGLALLMPDGFTAASSWSDAAFSRI